MREKTRWARYQETLKLGQQKRSFRFFGEWALQAHNAGVRFPTNHHSTIRDGIHPETRELAARYVAKKGDNRNVGDPCF